MGIEEKNEQRKGVNKGLLHFTDKQDTTETQEGYCYLLLNKYQRICVFGFVISLVNHHQQTRFLLNSIQHRSIPFFSSLAIQLLNELSIRTPNISQALFKVPPFVIVGYICQLNVKQSVAANTGTHFM